jgi:glycosyltransferase involved in cell wall biosynthesis
MALAEARYLRHSYDLVIAIPQGPLRESFADEGELVEGSASLPLWGASARAWLVRSIRTARDALRLAALIRRRGIRLVLTNSAVSLAPVLAARIARVPVIVHARDVPVSRLAPLVFALHSLLARTVIAISRGLIPYFTRLGGADVVLIHEGIDLGRVKGGNGGSQFNDPLRLCVVGALDRRKAQDVAVEALGLLRDRQIDAALELVGRDENPPFTAAVRDRIRQLGLDDRIKLSGEADDIGDVFARTDILLAPSRGEWTPLVLMEALAHETPVVASRVGGVPDIVISGETGLLTPPADAESLASSVAELAADPVRARAMSSRGRAHVASHFSQATSLAALREQIELALETAP